MGVKMRVYDGNSVKEYEHVQAIIFDGRDCQFVCKDKLGTFYARCYDALQIIPIKEGQNANNTEENGLSSDKD